LENSPGMIAGVRGDTCRTTTRRRFLSTSFSSEGRRRGRRRQFYSAAQNWPSALVESTSRQHNAATPVDLAAGWGWAGGRHDRVPPSSSLSISHPVSRCSRAPHWQTAPSISLLQSPLCRYVAHIVLTNYL